MVLRPEFLRNLAVYSESWYNIEEEPSALAFIDASEKLEELAVRVINLVEHHQLDLSRLSPRQNISTTITFEKERKPALHYDADSYWDQVLGKWISYRYHPPILCIQKEFKGCLQSKALFLPNEAASFSLAMEELDKTFKDSFKLVKAYLNEVRAGMLIQELQKAAKNTMDTGYPTETCYEPLSLTPPELTKACVSLISAAILAKYSDEHRKNCTVVSPLCEDNQNVIVCEKNLNCRSRILKEKNLEIDSQREEPIHLLSLNVWQ
ncbi:unnamed protein product [Lepeophtheirus salmonis]|uniref:(salmon louse) hypothetical protein n=1 Tax=Lepeophtheirus salmonis TaxID=72036 RepID=A0A7R8H3R0_LEPSM|nr:unnamed protein product [Lepeophtheirus salmonis]CAF2847750.1 unnamed protein product [Lepeophtheirus salmonis]